MPILDSDEFSNKLEKFKNLDMDEFNLYKLATVHEYNNAQVIQWSSDPVRSSVYLSVECGMLSDECLVSSVQYLSSSIYYLVSSI